jgi:hypothetical protein
MWCEFYKDDMETTLKKILGGLDHNKLLYDLLTHAYCAGRESLWAEIYAEKQAIVNVLSKNNKET